MKVKVGEALCYITLRPQILLGRPDDFDTKPEHFWINFVEFFLKLL